MDHTHIVTAADLHEYAKTRNSESVTPELIYLLVRQSVSQLSECRIPYGNAVNQPGLDGLVEAGQGFREFVPDGVSYWEIGTGANPQDKATTEFRKRNKEASASDRKNATFVFVSPRSRGAGGWDEAKQRAWKNRRKNRGWKNIRIIDGVKLADWLRELPAIGRWMAKKIGLSTSLGGFSTPVEHWETVLEPTGLPPQAFLAGREDACQALEGIFKSKEGKLYFFAESLHDVEDFVAAYLRSLDNDTARSYANRCLYVSDQDAWRSVAETRKPHVLVADSKLGVESENADLATIATRNGHAVIIPICGAQVGTGAKVIDLPSPGQNQLESVLYEAGYSSQRARELARVGSNRLSALRRHLLGQDTVPPYTRWKNARHLSQAGLAGKWDGNNNADQMALEGLLGKPYSDWIEALRSDVLQADSPLIHIDEKWRLVARGEAWNALGARVTDADLDRLQQTAIAVLGERDPKFDLPNEQRHAATIHGKQLKHSRFLREGLAETLALIGSRPEALSQCSHGKPRNTAFLVVRELLKDATWDHWASLNSLLPLLAEAAPDAFLDAIESALQDLDNSPFRELFAQEGRGVLPGENYLTGLLWALETLAWHPDFLPRVAVILADLASIDPGGNWANRPSRSLVDIFFPRHVQTTASLERRKIAVENIRREQPKVAWNLVLSLLPYSQGSTTGCHRPTWQNYIPSDWSEGITNTEYWEQTTTYADLAVELAKTNPEYLAELADRLPQLLKPAREALLKHLVSQETMALPPDKRLKIWETLGYLVRHHRRFADAKWAMPADMIARIEDVANTVAPGAPELIYRHLFSGRGVDLFNRKVDQDDYHEEQKRLEQARQNAVEEIFGAGGLDAVLDFAHSVSTPSEVGFALGGLGSEEAEARILPSFLESENETEQQIASGFIWGRFQTSNWIWADQVLENDWTNLQKSAFLVVLPFDENVWGRVENQLGQRNESLYWSNVQVRPFGRHRDLTLAIEKLIEFGRIPEAVNCVYRTTLKGRTFEVDLATGALFAVMKTPDKIRRLDSREAVDIITRLQNSPEVDPSALFKIEWYFLPWLDFSSSGSPKTLEKCLASDPAFFAEVIALIYRSQKEDEDSVPPSEQEQARAKNAYTLLSEWKTCPGTLPDGSFDSEAFSKWLEEAARIAEETGHREVAQMHIGQVFVHAPPDPGGLWIHRAVAAALNDRTAEEMRSGFTCQIFNQRGAHWFSAGEEERSLAQLNREKAEALDKEAYSRFATALRKVADIYDQDAERESKRDPRDHWS